MTLREAARRLALTLPPVRRLRDDRDILRQRLVSSDAAIAANAGSPLFHYRASFDAVALMTRHVDPDARPHPDHLTNFLGVRIDPAFLPTVLAGLAGHIEPTPIPANWHADIAEWAAALRAVELARDSFTVVELGCGWGCWLNNTGVAARRLGLTPRLIGVEGDAAHLAFAQQACRTNGFAPSEVTLLCGVAAASAGVALFPRQDQAGSHWGREPIFDATEAELEEARRTCLFDEVEMLPLCDVVPPTGIDLLHVDIQGGELDLIAGSLDILCSRVRYLVVGTHSRPIEGRIVETLSQAGWILEVERPAILALSGADPVLTIDGVQGWRNPRLADARPA